MKIKNNHIMKKFNIKVVFWTIISPFLLLLFAIIVASL